MTTFQGQFHLNNSICSHTCYFICTPGQPVTLLTPAIWRGSWQTSSIMSPGQTVTLLTPAIWQGSWQTSSVMSPGQPVTLLTQKDQPSDGAADRLPALCHRANQLYYWHQPSDGAADRLPALCHRANQLHYWPKKTSHLMGQLTDFQHYVIGPTSYTTDPKRPAIWRGSWQTSSIMSPRQPVTLLTQKDQPSDGAADRLPALCHRANQLYYWHQPSDGAADRLPALCHRANQLHYWPQKTSHLSGQMTDFQHYDWPSSGCSIRQTHIVTQIHMLFTWINHSTCW